MKPSPLTRSTPLRRRQKFNAKPVHDMATGRSFDSTEEYKRWNALQILERAGEIADLVFKPPAVVLDALAGIKWRIDFRYTEKGRTVWEDCKPRPMTPAERIKVKLWMAYGPGPLRITGRGGKLMREINGRRA